MIIAYRAIPAIYEVLQPIATRSGGETYDGGELPGIVITGGGGGGGGYGGGGYGGGGGGYNGGGSGGNPPPPPPPPPTTPCAFSSAMQTDTSFNSNILSYYAKANNESKEDGYIKRADGSLQLPIERKDKSLKYGALSGKYTERLHTHPIVVGGSPYFSAEDIYNLNKMYVNNNIENVSNFRYMVASPYGILVLQISNETKYTTFANRYSTSDSVSSLKSVMDKSMVGNVVGTVAVITQAFLTFLNSSNSGLSFIMGDVNNSNDSINWNVKEMQNDTIRNKTCN
jgi:hypothetical protein